MKKTSLRMLILLLMDLAVLSGLAALPATCFAAEELSVTMSLDKEGVVQAGDSVTMTLTPSGGTPPYTYTYTICFLEHDEKHYLSDRTSDNSHTWLVGFGESVVFIGGARDADGKFAAASELSLEVKGSVYNPLVVTGESLSPGDVINVGDTITYTVFVEGGQPPYSYIYKLELLQDDWWIIPEDGHSVFTSNSFSYTPTRGTYGNFCSGITDSLGRYTNTLSDVNFTILGDNHASMNFSATPGMKKLAQNKYRLTIQASASGGTQPVNFFCFWQTYKNGELTGKMTDKNTDGAFSLEGDFDLVSAVLHAMDADGWSGLDFIQLTFDTKDAMPILSELIRTDLLGNSLRNSLREDLFGPDWGDLIGQLDDIPELVLPPIPVPDLINPGLTNPGLTNPGLTNPGLTAPEIVKPGISQPGITAPQLPALKPPSLPRP